MLLKSEWLGVVLRLAILREKAHGGSASVFDLAGAHRPDERNEEHCCDYDAEGD
jgi:hypothetical protein